MWCSQGLSRLKVLKKAAGSLKLPDDQPIPSNIQVRLYFYCDLQDKFALSSYQQIIQEAIADRELLDLMNQCHLVYRVCF